MIAHPRRGRWPHRHRSLRSRSPCWPALQAATGPNSLEDRLRPDRKGAPPRSTPTSARCAASLKAIEFSHPVRQARHHSSGAFVVAYLSGDERRLTPCIIKASPAIRRWRRSRPCGWIAQRFVAPESESAVTAPSRAASSSVDWIPTGLLPGGREPPAAPPPIGADGSGLR